MQTLFNILQEKTPLNVPACSCTIGNFDGLHLGHQELVHHAKNHGQKLGIPALALTFDPPPEYYFRPNPKPKRLFTLEQKLRAFSEAQLDYAVVECFDEVLSSMTPNQFIDEYLGKLLKAHHVSIGGNFRFGKDRAGTVQDLEKRGLALTISEHVAQNSKIVSSSRIRESLAVGNVTLARTMLGRPYLLEGATTPGAKLGRTIGVPTLNLSPKDQLVPGNGVYAGYVLLKSEHAKMLSVAKSAKPAVINIGVRPTVSNQMELRIEAHVIGENFAPDSHYHQYLGIYFQEKLREEKKFGDLTELREAIANDILRAKTIL